MVFIYVGIALSIWFSLAEIIAVYKPRLRHYVIHLPIFLALSFGFFAGMVDEQIGYEHHYSPFLGIANGVDFYRFLFFKNWAYSVFIICFAFLSYESTKFIARKYASKHPNSRTTTAEFMRDLP